MDCVLVIMTNESRIVTFCGCTSNSALGQRRKVLWRNGIHNAGDEPPQALTQDEIACQKLKGEKKKSKINIAIDVIIKHKKIHILKMEFICQ